MGIWIGTGLMLASLISIATQLLHLKADKIKLKLYATHVIFSTTLYTLGIITYVLTIDLEGFWMWGYGLLMGVFVGYIWSSQRQSYKNAVALRESQDRLEESLK